MARIFWPRGASAARFLIGGLVLLTSIMGCAHLGKSPAQTSTTGSTPRPTETAEAPQGSASHPADSESTQANSPPTTAKPDQSPSTGTSSKNGTDNSSIAKPRNSNG